MRVQSTNRTTGIGMTTTNDNAHWISSYTWSVSNDILRDLSAPCPARRRRSARGHLSDAGPQARRQRAGDQRDHGRRLGARPEHGRNRQVTRERGRLLRQQRCSRHLPHADNTQRRGDTAAGNRAGARLSTRTLTEGTRSRPRRGLRSAPATLATRATSTGISKNCGRNNTRSTTSRDGLANDIDELNRNVIRPHGTDDHTGRPAPARERRRDVDVQPSRARPVDDDHIREPDLPRSSEHDPPRNGHSRVCIPMLSPKLCDYCDQGPPTRCCSPRSCAAARGTRPSATPTCASGAGTTRCWSSTTSA